MQTVDIAAFKNKTERYKWSVYQELLSLAALATFC
jgi:hypothetical protein